MQQHPSPNDDTPTISGWLQSYNYDGWPIDKLYGNSSGDHTAWSDLDVNIAAAVLCVEIMSRVKFCAPLNRQ